MKILDIAKPLVDRGTQLAGAVVGTAGRRAGELVARARNRNPEPKADMSDPTLKTKVESTIGRIPGIPASAVDVTVVDRVVTLHGQVKTTTQMTTLRNAVAAIPEVEAVEIQLHLPKTPAPSTPKAGQRKQTRKPAAPKAKAATQRSGRFNRDRTGTAPGTAAEPTPVELAAAGKGRQPAPLGSTEPAGAGSTPSTGESAPGTDEPRGTAGSPKTPAISTGTSRAVKPTGSSST